MNWLIQQMSRRSVQLATAALFVWLGLIAQAHAQSPIRIQFAKGAISGEWKGTIYRGSQDFVLRLGQGQSLTVSSPDVYTWSVRGPNGRELGCNGSNYCSPAEDIFSLPLSGDYLISTSYRMSSCATCPVANSRNVNVVFIVK